MDDIRSTVEGINLAWKEGRFDDLSQFFDENVVMKGPAFKELTRGRAASIHSYREFMAQSQVREYMDSNHSVAQWGQTASVTYDWTMTYEQDGKVSRESGQDMFVFVRDSERWMAVLRVMLF